jgi:uncharacterized protein YdeI (BOF family)
MKDKECQVKPSYNLQMAVDSEAELIVAHEVSDAAADSGKLLPIVNQIEENVGFSPSEVSADKAYHMGSDLENLEKRNVVTYIPEQGRGQAQTPEQHAAVAAVHNAETLTDEQWKALPTAANKKISRDAFVFNADADTPTPVRWESSYWPGRCSCNRPRVARSSGRSIEPKRERA